MLSKVRRAAAEVLYRNLRHARNLQAEKDDLAQRVAELELKLNAPPPSADILAYETTAPKRVEGKPKKAQFHFVEDYERHVQNLIDSHPIDEAMSMAVGGYYHEIGMIEAAAVQYAGLLRGMHLVDLGCGSGRLPVSLSKHLEVQYTGIDIVQQLLDYAKANSPGHFRYINNRTLSIPCATGSADMVSAFSLFTHLLHPETYLYLEDAFRVLKPGGKVIFSFLEFQMPAHWQTFDITVEMQRNDTMPALNQFIELNSIMAWCSRLGFLFERYIPGNDNPWIGQPPLGQSIAVLRKPS